MHNLFLPCGQSLLTQILRFAQDDSFFAQDDSFASLRMTASSLRMTASLRSG